MIGTTFLICLLGLDPRGAAMSKADREVGLALSAEARGDLAGRAEHLVKATLADRDHALARGLLGQMHLGEQWRAADADTALENAEVARRRSIYRSHRANTPSTPEAQSKLADWCRANGLLEEERAHLTAITELAAHGDRVADAWKRLGFRSHGGRWLTAEQIDAEARDRELQREANRRYLPMLGRLRGSLANPKQRDTAEREIAQVTDARAVPAVAAIFARDSLKDQRVAVQILGQIDAMSATEVLATLAVRSPHAEIHATATQILSQRDPRGILGWLIGMVQPRVSYDVVEGRDARRPFALRVNDGDQLIERTYDSSPRFVPGTGFRGFIGTGDDGLPIAVSGHALRRLWESQGTVDQGPAMAAALNDLESKRTQYLTALEDATEQARQQLAADVVGLETHNAGIAHGNEWHVLPVLRAVTGENFGEDREAWMKWWVDQLGYHYRKEASPGQETRTKVVRQSVFTGQSIPVYSCFAAGTLVRTREGHRPIETLEVGDVVLALDTNTGALSHEPIVGVHHNPPGAVVELDLGEERIAATGYHRFWKPSAGWAMARALRVGDRVRTLRGIETIEGIAQGAVQPVYNLDVAGGRTFFAGHVDALVHDNSLPDTPGAVFDRIGVGAVDAGHEREAARAPENP